MAIVAGLHAVVLPQTVTRVKMMSASAMPNAIAASIASSTDTCLTAAETQYNTILEMRGKA